MYIFQLLILVLLTTYVSSRSQHITDDEDIFEDALLEHLRDIEVEDDDYYDDRRSEDDDDPELSKEQLLKVLNVIKKEAHEHHVKLKRSDKREYFSSKSKKTTQDESKHSIVKKKELLLDSKHDEVVQPVAKAEKENSENDDSENSQVASVEVDNSLDQENEIIKKINLREILEKDGNTIVTNPPDEKKPSHAHIKQEKVVSTKSDNKGLDKVSFIAVIVGCCVAAIGGLSLAAYCWYKLRVENRDDENPKPVKKTSKKKKRNEQNDEKPISKDEEMNVNAEYYNYQHAKNQLKQMEKPKELSDKLAGAESSEEEEDEDTVYECPGLAAPGDMRVVNPMFSDGESRHSDKTSHDGSPTPPNERIDSVSNGNNNNYYMP